MGKFFRPGAGRDVDGSAPGVRPAVAGGGAFLAERITGSGTGAARPGPRVHR
jgi:hypothetical protein